MNIIDFVNGLLVRKHFGLCLKCGYIGVKSVRTCANCNKVLEKLPDETNYAKFHEKARKQSGIPLKPINNFLIKGMSLEEDEFIILSEKYFSTDLIRIKKNGNLSTLSVEGERTAINRIILSTQKIYFVSAFLWGWKAIEKYKYDDIIGYRKLPCSYSSVFLNKNDKLSITTSNDTFYLLEGFNPEKFHDLIIDCINQFKSNKGENGDARGTSYVTPDFNTNVKAPKKG
jgi:hypothetical protein